MGLGGGGGGQTGWTYSGSCAQWICIGPVHALYSIQNGDTYVFGGDSGLPGPVYASGADGDGKTVITTAFGVIHFFWGKANQLQSAVLAALQIDIGAGLQTVPTPNYKRICFAVLINAQFGTQTTPPTLRWEIERRSDELTLSAHTLDADGIVPEIVYGLLTDTLIGGAIDPADMILADFVEAAETVIAEGLGVSPVFDDAESLRDQIGKLNFYVDAYLFFSLGKLRYKLHRPPAANYVYPTIDISNLLDEPVPSHMGFDETWNATNITFTDRENKWEDTSEPGPFDAANFNASGELKVQTLDFPFVTRREVAKKIAARIGAKAGNPILKWELAIKNDPYVAGEPTPGLNPGDPDIPPPPRYPSPGDFIRLTYGKLGVSQRICRVIEVTLPSGSQRRIALTVQEQTARDATHDYQVPADSFSIPPFLDTVGTGDFAIVSTTPRLSTLPTALKDGKADGFLMAVQRTTGSMLRSQAWLSYDPGAGNYALQGAQTKFPAFGELIFWERFGDNFLARVRLANTWDATFLDAMVAANQEIYLVTGRRIISRNGATMDEHEVMAGWHGKVLGGKFTYLAADLVDIEFTTGGFSTPGLAYEEIGAHGTSPGSVVYIGTQDCFFIKTSDVMNFDRNAGNGVGDVGFERAVKAPVANHKKIEAVNDVDPAIFDRNDLSGSPDGTYDAPHQWGDRNPTAAEFFDVESGNVVTQGYSNQLALWTDLDVALGAMFDGTATAAQIALASDVNEVLGAMISGKNLTVYNSTVIAGSDAIPAPVFSVYPDDYADLVGWWEAGDIVGASNGDTVGSGGREVPDKLGGSNVLTDGGGSLPPVFSDVYGRNGFPCIIYRITTNADQSVLTFTGLTTATEFTVLAVLRPDSNAFSASNPILLRNSGDTVRLLPAYNPSSTLLRPALWDGSTLWEGSNYRNYPVVLTEVPRLYSFRRTGSAVVFDINNVPRGTATLAGSVTWGVLGSNGAAANKQHLFEVAIFNRKLTDGEIADLYNLYFQPKYSL